MTLPEWDTFSDPNLDYPTVAVSADGLDTNDVLVTPDDDLHDVEGVSVNLHEQVVEVNVRTRNEGRTYSIEFPWDAPVRVLAYDARNRIGELKAGTRRKRGPK